MKARALKIEYWSRRVSFLTFMGIAICAGLYVYFISDSVFNAGSRKEIVEEANFLEATVATLESDYLAKLSLINLEYAKSLGFVDSANNATYAALDRSAVSMNLAEDEI